MAISPMAFDSSLNSLPPSMFGFIPDKGISNCQSQADFDNTVDSLKASPQSDGIVYGARKNMQADAYAAEQMDINTKFQSFMSKELQLREEERERELLNEQIAKFEKLKKQKEQKEYDEKFSKYLDRISERTEEFILQVEKKKIEDELYSEMMLGKMLDKKDEFTDRFVNKMHQLHINELSEMKKPTSRPRCAPRLYIKSTTVSFP
jgi:hypothetical protein